MPRLLATLIFIGLLLAPSCGLPRTASPQPASPAVEASTPAPTHLKDAELLLSELRPQDTNYQHRPTLVWFKDAAHDHAECRADCSGFVAAVLQHSYHLSDGDLELVFGTERPLAHQFVSAIEASRRFTPIRRVQDAGAGDIIAIRYPSGNDNTGHVMILASLPRPRNPTPPLIEGTRQWDLDIIDSTGSPHSDDSRHAPGENPRSGAGRGTFRLYTNPDGTICGHAWSDSSKSAFRPQSDRHLVIGHFNP